MIYFFSLSLIIYLFFTIIEPKLIFLTFIRIIYLSTCIFSYLHFTITSNLINIVFIVYFICDAIKVFIIFDKNYIKSLSLFKQDKYLAKKENKQFWFIFIISFILIFIASEGNLNFINPRLFYEFLIESNRSGSILWPILALIIGQLLATYSYSLRNLTLITGLSYFLGSKGLVVNPSIFFMQYVFLYKKNYRKFIVPLSILFVCLLSYYLNIISNKNLFQFFTSYYDYTANIERIDEKIPLLPNPKYFLAYFTDFFPGINRILRTVPQELYADYFSFEYGNGKSPGILFFDSLLRIGILLYPFFILLEALLIKALINIFLKTNSILALRLLIFKESIKASLLVFLINFISLNAKTIIYKKYLYK